MAGSRLWLSVLAASVVYSQTTTLTLDGTTAVLTGDNVLPTNVTYLSFSSTIYLTSTGLSTGLSSLNATNGTSSTRRSTTNEPSTTRLGGISTSRGTQTSSSARPSNTQACNGHPDFCNRKYSNITMVAAHNYPFVRKNNVASNQVLGVIDQLNDGVRMLQGQAHYENNTMYYCHSSCDLLNVGRVVDQFIQIRQWVEAHPFDVVTILIGNSDYEQVQVEPFVDPIVNSGLDRYAYIPPQIPMALDAWPTLSEMILTQKRVVIFLDYNANQTKVPYILDEFSQMWETPFSPTDPAFPCTQQRPPGINRQQAQERLYLANHNLNTPIAFLGTNILVPNYANINITNAVSGNSSLGVAANSCTSDWGRPPNFLLVDFYNYGNFPGSVFEVAAQQNNVTYSSKCCGSEARSPAPRSVQVKGTSVVGLVVFLVVMFFGL